LVSAKPTTSPRSLIAFAWTSNESTRGDLRIVALGEQAPRAARVAFVAVTASVPTATVTATAPMRNRPDAMSPPITEPA
jgi:hypothetical protein